MDRKEKQRLAEQLSEPFGVCPVVTSLFKAEGSSKPPHSEGENQTRRFGM